jgi:hypothetical protein
MMDSPPRKVVIHTKRHDGNSAATRLGWTVGIRVSGKTLKVPEMAAVEAAVKLYAAVDPASKH